MQNCTSAVKEDAAATDLGLSFQLPPMRGLRPALLLTGIISVDIAIDDSGIFKTSNLVISNELTEATTLPRGAKADTDDNIATINNEYME